MRREKRQHCAIDYRYRFALLLVAWLKVLW